MLRGYQLFILAIGLFLAGASPPDGKQVQTNATEQLKPAPTPTPDYTPYPRYNPDPCYRDKDHDAADLCAQWRAALAAEKTAGLARWGNWIAAIASFLSFASIFLVILALRQTDKSLHIAHKDRATATRRALAQAEETQHALHIAKQTAETATAHAMIAEATADHQLRPYLGIEQILPKDPTAKTRSIEIRIKNFGSTPATNIKQEMGFAFFQLGDDSWPVFLGTVDLGREIPPSHIQPAIVGLKDRKDELHRVLQAQGVFKMILRLSYDGLGKKRAPLIAKIIFSHRGAMVAVESMTGPFTDGV